ncbi:WD40 repeat protein [Phaffia rhodozyma]|uniref:WD40 repeat protein n=1 Tax=Phaffia rhodozyma TaxID=264483 RepID=A0A0F7SLH9_PHARH|nr:WD40 repeat protein [Phaffia rhodozyma]
MNVELLSPFLQDFPDAITTTLDDSAICSRFNHAGVFAGSFIASGRADGAVCVWDVETKRPVWIEQGHAESVETVCWSRNSRFLLTSSRDATCIIWDLETGDRKQVIRFKAPVLGAFFHPHNSQIFLATLSTHETYLVDLRPSSRGRYELFDTDTSDPTYSSSTNGQSDEKGKGKDIRKTSGFVVAKFSPDGRKIFLGTRSGELIVMDGETRLVETRTKLCNAIIKSMEFDLSGRNLVINSSDRAVRVLSVAPVYPEDPRSVFRVELLHRFQDTINRTPWCGVGFSGDGEYVFGGAGHRISHDIYIWDRSSGTLVKVLEGPKQPLDDVHWHPTKPVIASVSSLGSIHLWVTAQADTWSAFAPGFEELEENAIYAEKEDEFDVEDESSLLRRKLQEEDNPIDILHRSPLFASITLPDPPPLLTLPSNDPVRAKSESPTTGWWWDIEPDEDTKLDWFMPLRLDENGRVLRVDMDFF